MKSDLKGDFSRLRFEAGKNYTAVVQQQGRVALDSDGNEANAIAAHLRTTETIDVIGKTGGPVHDFGFEVTVSGNAIEIGAGRYYVDGLLCENFSKTSYDKQDYLLGPFPTGEEIIEALGAGAVSEVQLYLEVWQRLATALDDPCLREPALGEADTTARMQTIFRVIAQRVPAGGGGGGGDCCASMDDVVLPPASTGKMSAQTPTTNDCGCTPVAPSGYRGLENQLYRVEVHESGDETTATWKWSRENGSVVVEVTGVAANSVHVESLGPDANLGFAIGDWVEIYDDATLFGLQPNLAGDLYQIKDIQRPTRTVVMTATVAAVDPTRNARMRRWDQTTGDATGVPMTAATAELENGIEVQFAAGSYHAGDFWLIPARAASGEILWPPCGGDGALFQSPSQTRVLAIPLACIHLEDGKPKVYDCRKKFYPLTELTPAKTSCCCTYRVGDNVSTFGDFATIQEALDALPAEGGEICLLPGLIYANALIFNRSDVVIHGCGWQTRVASRSLRRSSPQDPDPVGASKAVNPFKAVFSIVASHHVQLKNFAVEAADDEVGVLIDGVELSLDPDRDYLNVRGPARLRGAVDITLENLTLTAFAYPAVLAVSARILRIDRNRVAMRDGFSKWPSVYVSGKEIHIDGNWIGVQSAANDADWLPETVAGDIDRPLLAAAPRSPEISHPGGLQIGGPSTDVYVLENEIQGGAANGITLGSFDIIDANGKVTGIWTGIYPNGDDGCDCGGTLQTGTSYGDGYSLVAGGILAGIQIHRNRIRETGLCGIGPVGFFDLLTTLEIITIDGLIISQNEISNTLRREIAASSVAGDVYVANAFGYGAICVPDVADLIVKDNVILSFGARPGAPVCGIFVLHAEVVEISGNQVIENRDWTETFKEKVSATAFARGGIFIFAATPPVFVAEVEIQDPGIAGETEVAAPLFEPGLPAARIGGNVVRTPVSIGLSLFGFGPFAIRGNHLSCGGKVPVGPYGLGETLVVLNLSLAIDALMAELLPSSVLGAAFAPASAGDVLPLGFGSSGACVVTDNICQLEAGANGQTELTSVWVLTLDHLIFSDNQCWLEADRSSALIADAFLIGMSLNVVGNRFQESPRSISGKIFSAPVSAVTLGAVNVTGQNISTFCLLALGLKLADNNNLAFACDLGFRDKVKAGLEALANS